MHTPRQFLRQLLIYAAFLAFCGALLYFFLPAGYLTKAFPLLILFFLGLTWMIVRFLLRATEKSFMKFVNTFMLATGLKLLVLIIIAVAYIFLNRADVIPFLAAFFILYLLFTGFEVYAVITLSKHQKKE